MRGTFAKNLIELASVDPSIILLTGDLGYSVLEDFAKLFPERFYNVGVAEQSLIGTASGLASQGLKVFAYSIGNFPVFRALEQIRNDVYYHNSSVCIVGVGSGFDYGSAGYSHWMIEDVAAISALENFGIFTPSSEQSVINCLNEFINGKDPIYLSLGKLPNESASKRVVPKFLDEGGWALYRSTSPKDLVFTSGSITHDVLASSSKELLGTVISCERLQPIDFSAVESYIKDADSIKVVEERIWAGGLGSRLLKHLSLSKQNPHFSWYGVNSTNLTHTAGDRRYQLETNGFAFLFD